MTDNLNLRALALDMLIEINEEGLYSHLVLRDVLSKYQYLGKQERAFLTRLVEGTIERTITLDYVIDSFSKTKTRKMKPLIRNLLRMSVYQIMYMDSVPDSAACNEAVKLARKRGFSGLSGFVNGVLRSVSRGWKDIKSDSLSVRYSMPEWIIELWEKDYGRDRTIDILEGISREAKLTIRTNPGKTTPEELKARLEAEGVRVEPVKELGYAFSISGFDHLSALESFKDGLFYVQDLSSMMVAEAAAPKAGDYVIDVCAAPGGKSTHIAELLKGTGMVEARDLTETKVSLIEENIARHGLLNMKAVQMDATVYDESSHHKADILICDLPCSGLGVMARKTDIRYKIMQDKLQDIVVLQRKIAAQVLDYVKPGGTVIYSTCTVNRAENEEMVEWILLKNPDFMRVWERQIFPGEMESDGFYLARLQKTASK